MLGFFFFFFVKGFTVLNRYQTNINLRPKKPSTILGTQYFLAFYKISRSSRESHSIEYFNGRMRINLYRCKFVKDFKLGFDIAKICYRESIYYKYLHNKVVGSKKKSVLQQKAKRNLGPNPKWVIKYTHTTENKYLKLSFILYKLH